MGQPFYVTTPIYYPNDVPHIGHAYSSVAADALARWRRLWGDDVMFLTGTDEHGLKMQRTAEAEGISPKDLVDRTSPAFRELTTLLDLTNTDFIRTTEDRHYKAVSEFLQVVYDNGYIELGTYEGLYCVSCEAYYGEDELVDGSCPIHKRPVERVTEENYFFQLSRFEDRLLQHYTDNPEAVQPETRRNEVLGFIKQGLRDFSMSRTSLTWGIPLPWDPKHVTYVWFDALFNYCTAIGYGTDRERFDRYWPVDYHIIGKDILRFHAVYWPAMLMAGNEAPPKHVFAHGFLLAGGEKIAKSGNNAIAPAKLVEEFGSDGYRYHFLVDQRFGPDGDFSYEALVAQHGGELLRQRRADDESGRSTGHRECDCVRGDAARDGTPRLRRGVRRGVGAHPRDERVHRRPGPLEAAQGRRGRRGCWRARRLHRGAADRRAARIAGDPASERRALATPRVGGHATGAGVARGGSVGSWPGRHHAREG
jgi:methionyl-tRNA synthetase